MISMHSDDAVNRAIGEELKQARRSRGWSRPDLVAHLPLRMPVNTYACYEQGIRPCPIARLMEFCQALGVDVGHLVSRAWTRLEDGALDVEELLSSAQRFPF